ncbi:acylneuraminate cytidylyltransferase [Paenibacillus yonginensis]|uniref:N-acylneuraminate cytidylyltransferase n=2 Tax=Paenibacillus yonginensis TaxID=1462996 RepID=A0A1B1N3R8_9BACL|nr:acylneuraminate cytidylyltransferase [Paenibacillus yonginensis]
MNYRTVAFIPVRGGSKSIPLKNIKNFFGKPLVYWTIKAAAEADIITKVVVATDSAEIEQVVSSFGFDNVEIYHRSAESATDQAATEDVLLEFAEKEMFDYIFLIQATSPLLQTQDLQSAYSQYINEKADSLLSVVLQKRFVWRKEENSRFFSPLNYDPNNRPRRQDWDGYFVENGAFYLTSRSALINSRCRVSGKVLTFQMHEDTYFEIDEPSDWEVVEKLMAKRLHTKVSDLSNINLLVTDVDGVLTDAGMYYSENGNELKKFNTRDGKGIELLRATGTKVMILTSENRELVRNRAEKLKVDFLGMGVLNKVAFLDDFFRQNPEFSYKTTAYIGDDVNDLEALSQVAFSASPVNAVTDVLEKVMYVSTYKGGEGCVREICDLIIKSKSNG